jgi:sortase A
MLFKAGMIFSENRLPPRIKSAAGFFRIMLQARPPVPPPCLRRAAFPRGRAPPFRRGIHEPTMSRLSIALVLAAAGAIQFGQGIYIHAKALLAQVLLERAFAETITTGRAVKPWPWADTWPEARITVKRIGASAIALAGSSGQALAFGPGHVERTADAGEPGVAVYAAHRDTHFRFLKDVAIGDEIDVTRHDGKTFRYRADGTAIVRFDQSGINPFIAGHELVLTTCWPFDAMAHGPMRYVLHAAMISPPMPEPYSPL